MSNMSGFASLYPTYEIMLHNHLEMVLHTLDSDSVSKDYTHQHLSLPSQIIIHHLYQFVHPQLCKCKYAILKRSIQLKFKRTNL